MALLLLAGGASAQEDALAGLRQAAKSAPNDLEAQLSLGRGLIRAGRLAEAEAQMRVAARLGKGSIEVLYEAMRARFAGGDYRKARAGCQELIKKDKNHVLSNVCMARAFLVWRRSSRASEYIELAQKADPNHYEVALVVADQKRIEGEYEAARQAYEQALARKPASSEAELGLGRVLLLENKTPAAIEALRKAHALDPSDPDIAYELGRQLSGPEATALLGQALAGRPDWPAAKLELALAQLRAGDAATADASLVAYLKKNPNNPIAVAHHGAALVALGHYPEAESVLKKALELVPNDYDTSFALAQLYEHTNRYEEAFTQYRNAADLKRESPLPLIAAAKLGLSLQRPLLSGALLDKALERTPRSAEALALYGDVLAARGDKAAAREHYQRALAGEGAIDRAAVQKRLAELK